MKKLYKERNKKGGQFYPIREVHLLVMLFLWMTAGIQAQTGFLSTQEKKLTPGPDAAIVVEGGSTSTIYSTVNPKIKPWSHAQANFEQQLLMVDFRNVFSLEYLRSSINDLLKDVMLVPKSSSYAVALSVYLYNPGFEDGLGRLLYRSTTSKSAMGEQTLTINASPFSATYLPLIPQAPAYSTVFHTGPGTAIQQILQLAGTPFNNKSVDCIPDVGVGWKENYKPLDVGKSLFLSALTDPYLNCNLTSLGRQPVVIQLQITNATVQNVFVPFIGTIDKSYFRKTGPVAAPDEKIGESYTDISMTRPDCIVEVHSGFDDRTLSESRYFSINQKWEHIKKPASSYTDYSPTNKSTIAARLGDRMVIKVRKKNNNSKPIISGIPGVWVSGYGYSMAFMCSPNVTPGEFNPFIPWETSTHMKNYNRYPPDFQITVPDWQLVDDYWIWSWVLQREMNATKDKYNPQVLFPQKRTYPSNGLVQTEGQAIGHLNEFMYYWKAGTNNGANSNYVPNSNAGKYTGTWDADEILYKGSVQFKQVPKEGNVSLLQTKIAKNNLNKDAIAWQVIRPGTEQQTFTPQGYPASGFAMNEYISLYRRYKHLLYPETPEPHYYDGYLIEDYYAYRKSKMDGPALKADNTGMPATIELDTWYNPQLGEANVTNPGQVNILSVGDNISFNLQVASPLINPGNPEIFPGFYSSVKGTNNPMSWEQKTRYTLTGLQQFTAADLSRLSVALPTDCPQRDERLGWTGDAQIFSRTSSFLMDVNNFFLKWMKDLAIDQFSDGNVPYVIPNVLGNGGGAAGWGDAATIIPWNMYLAYGDKRMLEYQYPSMKAWVEYIRSQSRDHLIITGHQYGDWLFFSVHDDLDGISALTNKYFIAQCFYAHSVQLLINTAKVLGKSSDVIEYTILIEKIKEAFLKEYITFNGATMSNTQTSYVLALNFDMLPESMQNQAADRLVNNIRQYGNHLTTGFLGTPYLCHVLSRFGHNDVAYKLLLQDTYPSWLYPVKMGATTIWERWGGVKPDSTFETGMNSFNHYAYGAIGDWMYRVMAGLDTENNEAGAGYKKNIISPHIDTSIGAVSASLETRYGPLASSWQILNGELLLIAEIPPNTTATIYIPADANFISENGQLLKEQTEIKVLETGNGKTVVNCGSGKYRFTTSKKREETSYK